MARGALRELTGYLRKYHLAPRYPRESVTRLLADDGTPIVAHRLAGPADAVAAVVVVHGFVNWSRTPALHRFSTHLARHFHVVVPDLRGHGRSGGRCTLGKSEHLDVAAAVQTCPPGLPVVLIGVSLGGVAVLRYAASAPGTVAAVIAVSAPVRRDASRPGSSRIVSVTSTRAGRRALSTLMRTRVAEGHHLPDIESELASIAPARCVIVHDRADHFFGPEHAEVLHAAASEPKELWWYDDAGHGLDLLTPVFADRVIEWVGDL